MEKEKLIDLVERAQAGDGAAMNELFESFYKPVYFFAKKTVKNEDLACDITQETFLEVFNTIGKLKEPVAFVSWMRKITYHQCTKYFKEKKEVLVDEDEDGNSIFDSLVDDSMDSIPPEVYEQEEFRKTILDMIDELTEEQRSALMMYYYDEMSVGQIAEVQDVSDGTVKSRLNYGRKAMKKSIEEYEKKHNIKLHSFSFMPLFMLFFGDELVPAEKLTQLKETVSQAIGTVGTGAAITAASTSASTAGGAVSAVAGAGAKVTAISLSGKIIAGVTALALVIGGVAFLSPSKWERHRCVDEDQDCQCDVCVDGSYHRSRDGVHGVCSDCGEWFGITTENKDSDVCLDCGEFPCGTNHGGIHYDYLDDQDGICDYCKMEITETVQVHTDRNEDGICEYCEDYHCHVNGTPEAGQLKDTDGDRKCDDCGEYLCVNHIIIYHEDKNRDDVCDFCQNYLWKK